MAEEARSRQHGLEQAASIIFALVAVVPLLIFAWTLHDLGAIRSTQAQISLVLAVGISLLGFWMFRSLLTRMAAVVLKLTAALEQAQPEPARAPRRPLTARDAGGRPVGAGRRRRRHRLDPRAQRGRPHDGRALVPRGERPPERARAGLGRQRA